jgi:predicted CXXCH cytochrome family protein
MSLSVRPGTNVLLLVAACAACALCAACSATTRHKVLSTLFDGVPPLRTAGPEGATPVGGPQAAALRAEAPRDHGPYAAHLCGACHEAAATNALVLPKDQLCFKCHELSLNRKFVHGPVVSGGCLVCHDPHSSRNPRLLVSGPGTVCFQCHDARDVARISGHEGVESGCTECHDAHASDQRFLLK